MTRRFMLTAATFLLLSTLPTGAADAALTPTIQKKVLDNGLSVLVYPDGAAQVVTVQVWYHVGSKNEVPGKRGLAHMFEHFMFKGTHKVGPEEMDKIVQGAGGRLNAFTTDDATVYYEIVPKEHV